MTESVIVSPIVHKGTPTKPGVYVTVMKGKPLTEDMRYFDGRYWGHPAGGFLTALDGIRLGSPLPWHKRQLRGTVAWWKEVTVTPKGKEIIWAALFGG
jgi:hypothetical protein